MTREEFLDSIAHFYPEYRKFVRSEPVPPGMTINEWLRTPPESFTEWVARTKGIYEQPRHDTRT